PVGDELVLRGHVDPVDVRMTDGRCGRGEDHRGRARVAGHLDDLLAGRATDDRVVDEQDVLAPELGRHRVELLPHALLSHRLTGHDEGPADVAVLVEALAILDAELAGDLHRRRAGGVRDRHDDVDLVERDVLRDRVGQTLPHPQTGLVDRDAVHDGVGTREIDVLEGAGGEGGVGRALPGEELALGRDEHGLSRLDLAHDLVVGVLEHERLARDHPLVGGALGPRTTAEDQRAD
ncbi:hypothetical protein ABE10_01295, partial [Bacillus toyonensis]|nr:hypothetical protein [Bacillus toyonensis]